MRIETALVISDVDLLDKKAGYSWENMKDLVAKEAAIYNILIFNGMVVKDRLGVLDL